MDTLGIYVHVPFCVRKCSYCDFNAYSGLGHLTDAYVEAICAEIRNAAEQPRHVSTIFFGGGTPTFLSGTQLGLIFGSLTDKFQVVADAEISAEANPTTIDAAKFTAMREAGFNRISIGVQSFDDRLLKLVDREHSGDEAAHAIVAARRAGFKNISLDLMFGLPSQSLEDWDQALDRAINLDTEHISTYSLTIEPGSRFERLHKGGKLNLPDEDIELEMYEHAIRKLEAAGFVHYEVSNFAKLGFESRHNLRYWRNEEYQGFGPGAVSYMDGRRSTNEKHPKKYISCVTDGGSLITESEKLDAHGAIAETLIQGLRLREGIGLLQVSNRFGVDVFELYKGTFNVLHSRGLLVWNSDNIRLTHRGLLLANDVFLEILPPL